MLGFVVSLVLLLWSFPEPRLARRVYRRQHTQPRPTQPAGLRIPVIISKQGVNALRSSR